ncbi:MAG: glycosyltransferase [Alphaproteobacteria bacterium]|nr:glycosyltransferase [Alphaproteobacteria bacterium]
MSILKRAPKVSLIVPCYNVGTHVLNCINALVCQDYSNFELIFVNDASTDNTGAVLDDALRFDERAVVVHSEKNMGAAAARNLGLDRARGKYVMFVDSDDIVEMDFISTMVANIERHKSDVAMCQVNIKLENGYSSRWAAIEISYVNRMLKNDVYDLAKSPAMVFVNAMVYNKIFRRDILKKYDIRFNEVLKTSEDTDFTLRYLLAAKRLSVVHRPLYTHFMRHNSLTSGLKSLAEFYGNNMETTWLAYEFLKKHKLYDRLEYLKLITISRVYSFSDFLMNETFGATQ